MTDFKAQEARLKAILGKKNLAVSYESLSVFRSYFDDNIVLPCELTGREDFGWEEYYVLGPGDKKEYEKLKKTRPSYRDIYVLLTFDPPIEEMEGLMVKVMRVPDRKKFVMPLANLKVIDKKSPNYQLLEDYAVWQVNY